MRRSSLIVTALTIVLMALAALAAVDSGRAGDSGQQVWWWMTVAGVACLGAAWLLTATARRQSQSRHFVRAAASGGLAAVLVPVGLLLVLGPIGMVLGLGLLAVVPICWNLGAIALTRAHRSSPDAAA